MYCIFPASLAISVFMPAIENLIADLFSATKLFTTALVSASLRFFRDCDMNSVKAMSGKNMWFEGSVYVSISHSLCFSFLEAISSSSLVSRHIFMLDLPYLFKRLYCILQRLCIRLLDDYLVAHRHNRHLVACIDAFAFPDVCRYDH